MCLNCPENCRKLKNPNVLDLFQMATSTISMHWKSQMSGYIENQAKKSKKSPRTTKTIIMLGACQDITFPFSYQALLMQLKQRPSEGHSSRPMWQENFERIPGKTDRSPAARGVM